jgi:hypothetical protein
LGTLYGRGFVFNVCYWHADPKITPGADDFLDGWNEAGQQGCGFPDENLEL